MAEEGETGDAHSSFLTLSRDHVKVRRQEYDAMWRGMRGKKNREGSADGL